MISIKSLACKMKTLQENKSSGILLTWKKYAPNELERRSKDPHPELTDVHRTSKGFVLGLSKGLHQPS